MNTKRFYVIPFFIFALWLTSFSEVNAQQNDDEFVVVLDAGHGGHDPGNLGNGYLEKNIALNIVLRVGAILEREQNVKVIYTRKDDTFIDLFVRGEIANKANADLFVSVHCDSHTSDAYGAGTFVLGLHANKQNFEIAKKENSVIYLEDNYESRYADYDINSPESVIGLTIMQEEFLDQSISLAKAIQDNFTGKLNRKNREVKQAGFIVLHQTFMPSVLVETGFLTNDAEGAYLNSKKGQSEMGTAIAEAILSYKGGVASSLSQAPQKVIMTAPDPEKEVLVNAPSTSKNTTIAERDVAEEFAKDPGANPMADKPAVAKEVEKTLEEKIADVDKAPDVVETAKEHVKEMVEQPKELPVDKVEEIVTKEEIIQQEEPEVVEVVKEVIEKPKSTVVENKEVVTTTPVTVSKPTKPEVSIEFRVQLLATTKDMPLDASRFNGLNKLSKERYKQFYRYMYGSTNSYSSAKELKKAADRNGYPASYIVAYKDGIRILTPDAIKMVSE